MRMVNYNSAPNPYYNREKQMAIATNSNSLAMYNGYGFGYNYQTKLNNQAYPMYNPYMQNMNFRNSAYCMDGQNTTDSYNDGWILGTPLGDEPLDIDKIVPPPRYTGYNPMVNKKLYENYHKRREEAVKRIGENNEKAYRTICKITGVEPDEERIKRFYPRKEDDDPNFVYTEYLSSEERDEYMKAVSEESTMDVYRQRAQMIDLYNQHPELFPPCTREQANLIKTQDKIRQIVKPDMSTVDFCFNAMPKIEQMSKDYEDFMKRADIRKLYNPADYSALLHQHQHAFDGVFKNRVGSTPEIHLPSEIQISDQEAERRKAEFMESIAMQGNNSVFPDNNAQQNNGGAFKWRK